MITEFNLSEPYSLDAKKIIYLSDESNFVQHTPGKIAPAIKMPQLILYKKSSCSQ